MWKKSRYIACFLRFRPEGKYYSLTQLRESDRSNNTYSPYTVHIESIYYCRYPIEIVYLSKKSRYRKTNIYSTESTTDYLKLFVVYISDIWCVNLDNFLLLFILYPSISRKKKNNLFKIIQNFVFN